MSSSEEEGREVGDSFCAECYGLGHSRIVKRDVKGFREIYVRAFECEDCGRTAEEVQLAGQYDPQGVRLRLSVPAGDAAALARRVLKSDTASVSIPELEFEIGAGAYVPFTGDLTTVSDVLVQACKNLNMNQAERRTADAETAGKIDAFIMELEEYAEGKHAFTFEVEDAAGNSFIEGPDGGAANGACEGGDPLLSVERFARTPAQESRMGLAMPDEFLPEEDAAAGGGGAGEPPASAAGRLILRVEGDAEVAAFLAAYAEPAELAMDAVLAAPAGIELPAACAACGAAGPAGFAAALHRPAAGAGLVASCLILRAACGACSATSAEVRSTGGVPAQGARLRLRVEGPADLERAVLQSASASLAVPDVELALSTGSAGGMATTVGQLISSLAAQLAGNPALAPAAGGDAAAAEEAADWADFGASLKAFATVERPWTLELTDPLACSLIGPKPADAAASRTQDPQLEVARYERTPDENAHFGLAAGGGAAPIA